MKNAVFDTVAVNMLASPDRPDGPLLRANGSTLVKSKADDSDHVLPPMNEGDTVDLLDTCRASPRRPRRR